ncbi:response regulator transcription factor [Dechloromonas sp. H13]|uniref:response regulator n=1 Tax=Dechloromonas sp. H13 TaxID=2570193 RepID=UPI0012924C7D|nr:response regulator transcription factor [Dechloromonas sp. H13]
MIDVLVVDDHAIFRSGLKRLLADEADMRVTGEAGNGQEALDMLQAGTWSVILLDINMTGRSGLDTLKRIRARWHEQPVLMLSMYPHEQYAAMALDAGANGYLSKDCDARELVQAIRIAAGGGYYLSPAAAGNIFVKLRKEGSQPPHYKLTPRELEILHLIIQGVSLTEIGKRLFLSVKTVSTYRTRLLEKLGVENNADLLRYALRHGLTDS